MDRSLYVNEKEEMIGIDDDSPFFIGTIYGVNFPKLIDLYVAEKGSDKWTKSKEEEQRKKWALKVIKVLCVHNKITKAEVDKLF